MYACGQRRSSFVVSMMANYKWNDERIHSSNFYLIKLRTGKRKRNVSSLCYKEWRKYRSIIKANIHHIYMYWTRMYKVIHDLYWHSSTGIEFHSVIYTKDDFITVLFYVNMSYTNDILVLYIDSKICPLYMHTNEVSFFYCFFFVNQICLIFDDEYVEENNNNNNNHHRSISISHDSISRNLLTMKDIRGYTKTVKENGNSIYKLSHIEKK